MQKWEYIKLIQAWSWEDGGGTQSETDRLRQMGMDGWELVTVLSFTGTSGQTIGFHFLFKRLLVTARDKIDHN